MKVSEIFASIQGEGRYIGRPQVFVRLAGCNLSCRWCDTGYAREGGVEKTVDEIVGEVGKHGIGSVCITGGEPMMQTAELRELIDKLKSMGYEIVLETNGTIYDKYIFESMDCVSVDMKPQSSGEKSDEEIIRKLCGKDQVKVVVADDRDLKYAGEIIAKAGDVEVILQPAGDKDFKYLAESVVDLKLNVSVLPKLNKLVGLR